jgi:hypothetical protein
MKNYWMVFQDGRHGKKPRQKHETKALACIEALRLANLRPGLKFVVMEVIAEYQFNSEDET